jgi:small subunit ribosomal protein S20
MANHKSALKQHRQSLKHRERNRGHRARMRTAVKKLRTAMAAGDKEGAKELLIPTLALIDRTAKLGAHHDNAAARTKSRLETAFNRMDAGN